MNTELVISRQFTIYLTNFNAILHLNYFDHMFINLLCKQGYDKAIETDLYYIPMNGLIDMTANLNLQVCRPLLTSVI